MTNYNGRIIKGIGGFYYVDTADGVFECRARGIFRKEGITPLVGDVVDISVDVPSKTGAVEDIKPRKNKLIRPSVANVNQVAIVTATAMPRPNLLLLDKLIAAAEYAGAKVLLCFNKTDIDKGSDIVQIYKNADFEVLTLSAETGEGTDKLVDYLKNNVTVFAGNSGVGKSSLLNCVFGREVFETGAVSDRVERGKHTTRHSELLQLPYGGYIIDTPGFGSFDIKLLEAEDCVKMFREFEPYTGSCRFRDCSHTVEKGCGVLNALGSGKIAPSRHESYCRIVREINEDRKRR